MRARSSYPRRIPRNSFSSGTYQKRHRVPASVGVTTHRKKVEPFVVVRSERLATLSVGTSIQPFGLYIDPMNTVAFAWVSQIAKCFESYKFKSVRFRFVSSSPTSTVGAVMMGVDYDPADAVIADRAKLLKELPMSASYKEFPVWKSSSLEVDVSKLNPQRKYVSDLTATNPPSRRWSESGVLYVVPTVEYATPTTIGALFVDYVLELTTPTACVPEGLSVLCELDKTNGVYMPVDTSVVPLATAGGGTEEPVPFTTQVPTPAAPVARWDTASVVSKAAGAVTAAAVTYATVKTGHECRNRLALIVTGTAAYRAGENMALTASDFLKKHSVHAGMATAVVPASVLLAASAIDAGFEPLAKRTPIGTAPLAAAVVAAGFSVKALIDGPPEGQSHARRDVELEPPPQFIWVSWAPLEFDVDCTTSIMTFGDVGVPPTLDGTGGSSGVTITGDYITATPFANVPEYSNGDVPWIAQYGPGPMYASCLQYKDVLSFDMDVHTTSPHDALTTVTRLSVLPNQTTLLNPYGASVVTFTSPTPNFSIVAGRLLLSEAPAILRSGFGGDEDPEVLCIVAPGANDHWTPSYASRSRSNVGSIREGLSVSPPTSPFYFYIPDSLGSATIETWRRDTPTSPWTPTTTFDLSPNHSVRRTPNGTSEYRFTSSDLGSLPLFMSTFDPYPR